LINQSFTKKRLGGKEKNGFENKKTQTKRKPKQKTPLNLKTPVDF